MQAEKKLTELKREDIIEAATNEFKKNGFRATSMDCIALRAQVSKRTVYNHFENKEALFQAITQQLFDNIMRVSEHPYDTDIPLEEQLRHIAKQEMVLLTCDDFMDLAKVISSESLNAPELTRTNIEAFQDSGLGVVKWIKQAIKDGKLSITDPIMAGKQFLSLIETFAFWPQLFNHSPVPSKKKQKVIIESAVAMFLNTYAT